MLLSALRTRARALGAASGAAVAVAAALQYQQQRPRAAAAAAPPLGGAPLLAQAPSAKQRLFCWGRLVPAGAADRPVRVREKTPVDVSFWSDRGLRIVQLTAGASHGAALDNKGGLWAWGGGAGPLPRKLPCRAALRSLASTDASLYAVTSRGAVLEWRDLGASLKPDATPPEEPAPLGGALTKTSAASLSAGNAHVLIVGRSGELVGYGDNRRGQLGMGDSKATPCCEAPTRLPALAAKATQAACGGAHSVVLLADGSCVAFGDDRNLQLGLRPTTVKALRTGATQADTPERVLMLRDKHVVAVAAGGGGLEGGHTVFQVRGAEGDELWTCGYGRWGQLGLKAYDHISELKPVTSLSKLREWDAESHRSSSIRVSEVICGEKHTAALLATGNVFVWGWNDQGQLGTGSSGTPTPTLLKSPPDLRFTILKGLGGGPNGTAAWS